MTKTSQNGYLDLSELRDKCKLAMSGKIIGKSIKQVYPNLQIASARCSKNWAKSTQKYFRMGAYR